MSISKEVGPYWDDYNKSKKFYDILVRAGYAGQVREINQIQSIVKNQIESFADHVFQDGSVVIPGELNYDLNYDYVKTTLPDLYSVYKDQLDSGDVFITGATSGIHALLQSSVDVEDSDPVTLFVKYVDSGISKSSSTFTQFEDINIYQKSNGNGIKFTITNPTGVFSVGETVTLDDGVNPEVVVQVNCHVGNKLFVSWFDEAQEPLNQASVTITGTTSSSSASSNAHENDKLFVLIATAPVDEIGVGSSATINEGVYYIGGRFVLVDKQTIVLDKYTNTPTYRIGLYSNESIVTEVDDVSLYDNAAGETNETAPGAHRLKVDLQLSKRNVSFTDDSKDFIELLKITNGELELQTRGPDYNVIDATLAERTYDESGDYVVERFPILFKDHATNPTTKITMNVERGRAYVKGFQVDKIGKSIIDINKAQTTEVLNNSSTNLNYGAYILINEVSSIPPFGDFDEVTFYDGAVTSIGDLPTGGTGAIGTARVRYMSHDSGTIDIKGATNKFKLYLFDIKDSNGVPSVGFLSSATCVYKAVGNFTADIASVDRTLVGGSLNAMVFPLSTLTNDSITDQSYNVVRVFEGTSSGGSVAFTAIADETFIDNYTLYLVTAEDGTTNTVSPIYDLSSGFTLTGGNKTLTLTGLTAATTIRVVAVMNRVITHKTKGAQNGSMTAATLVSGKLSLTKADAYEITSITDTTTTQDISNNFVLVKNKKENFYDVSYVQLKPGYAAPAGTIDVVFKYFSHGSGDYFSVDSYDSIPYEDIPYEMINSELINMADVVDFRPRISNNGLNYIDVGAVKTQIPYPYSQFTSDNTYYIPRKDVVYVNNDGVVDVVEGSPSVNPLSPILPSNSIALYEITYKPYTRLTSDIEVKEYDNRRYTMRDIGEIDSRIKNMERTITLSLLETDTAALQIVDANGLNRFKTGFMVDSFRDHEIADADNLEYFASIDPQAQVMRPDFNINATNLVVNTGTSTNETISNNVVTLPYTTSKIVEQPFATSTINVNPYAVFIWNGSVKLSPSDDTWVDVEFTDPIVINIGAVRNWWLSPWRSIANTRRGDGNRNVERTVVNDLLDVVSIPSIRTRDVSFVASNMLPNSIVHPFFDGVNVSGYITPSVLETDINGSVSGVFTIPNNDTLSFPSGERIFNLSSSPINEEAENISASQGTYTAEGILESRRRTVQRGWAVDPVAQTFSINKREGCFLSSIDLWFSSSSNDIPLTIEIREVVNGFPTRNTLIGGRIIMAPSDVLVSSDGTLNVTNCVFENPLYLEGNREYAVVILANTQEYNVWKSTLGEKILGTNNYVSKQPHTGVFFKSQNNSTWSPDQTSDLKFVLNRCVFDTTKTVTLNLESQAVDPWVGSVNAISSVSGSSTLTITCPNHCLLVNDTVPIYGLSNVADPQTTHAIPHTEINDINHVVTSVIDLDRFTIDVTTNADTTGFFDNGNIITINRGMFYSVLIPQIMDRVFDKTSLSYKITTKTGKSFDGSETAYVAGVTNKAVINNTENHLDLPMAVRGQQEGSSPTNDVIVTATMKSTLDTISPVIRADQSSVVLAGNRINNPATETSELDAVLLGESYARYISDATSLELDADSIKVFLDINRPQNSEAKLYYRTSYTPSEIVDVDWVTLPEQTNLGTSDNDRFYENEFGIDSISPFRTYQVKIVSNSANDAKVPTYKNLRVIALGT